MAPATVPVPAGILMVPFELGTLGREELRDLWLAWTADPSGPAVLDSGIRFRALLPDGTFEPDYQPIETESLVTMESEDLIPWSTIALCASGWLAAIMAMLLR